MKLVHPFVFLTVIVLTISLPLTAQIDIDNTLELSGADGTRAIKNLELPVDGTDAASKDYVDSQAGGGGSAHFVGEAYGGGIVYQIYKDSNGDEHGFIVDLTDKSAGRSWSATDNVTVPAPGAKSMWSGLANSAEIQAQNNDSAAGDCMNSNSGGQSDWYLPASTELNALWNNLSLVNRALSTAGGGATEIIPDYYWSSSENFTSNSRVIGFSRGNGDEYNKASSLRVRCVRGF